MCMIIATTDICKSCSDQTGKFPITSSKGHRYIFLFYHYNTNNIIGILIKSRNTSDLCEAWLQSFQMFKAHGKNPTIHILDNERSREMKKMFEKEDIIYQLIPPHIHRRNAVERAIRAYKNHLVTGLYACDPKLPSREWGQLLPHCNITINLLRSSRRNP